MTARAIGLALSLATAPVSAAAQCVVPDAAAQKLKVLFTYENGLGVNKPMREPFSVLKIGDRVYFRRNNPPPYYDRNSRPVYIFYPGRRIETLNCPSGPTWVNCVADWAQNPHKDQGKVVYGNEPPPIYTAPAPKEQACEFTLQVPAWQPSPDNELKRKLAAEILQEVQTFGGTSGTRAIYVRDFNVDDPEIGAYIINTAAEPEFLGCSFDAAKSPHCEWHGFGQSPVTMLKREIMARPYRLYPPPMGKP